MEIAIISDIHANAEALNAVLSEIDKRNISNIICLGDIVGYGPEPEECISIIRERNIPSILGNHDKAAIDYEIREEFSELARTAILWTEQQLSENSKNFLTNLPMTVDVYGQTFVHASPLMPENFRYIFSYADALPAFSSFYTPLCFIGHTHRPAMYCEDMTTREVEKGKKFIINIGSVGQPRDGDWRACFCLFDTEKFISRFVRLEYAVEETRKKILHAGLPQKLGDRLLVGI